jgi:sec-independent protein translocase protein TatA
MPFGLHPWYLIVVLAVVLIVFGPGKLPELGGAIGRGLREFQRATSSSTAHEPLPVAAAPVPQVGKVSAPAPRR